MSADPSLLLEYRCRARGCLLLKVWQTPNGPEFAAPGRRLSDRYTFARRLEQAAIGELVGAQDGMWAGRLDDCPVLMWIPLACDHVTVTIWISAIREHLVGRTPGQPARILWPLPDTEGN
jgi:hypothetical protein